MTNIINGVFDTIHKHFTHPVMEGYEKHIWNPMVKHYKVTYSVLATIIILPLIIRWFF